MSAVRLSKSSVGEEEKLALARVIDAGYLGMGREVQLFEQELAEFIGTRNKVICVNTGTAALHLAVQCLDIGPGDEVLVPSITFVASFQAVAASGARPVACEVTPERIFIDLDDAKRRLSPSTKAIMPVHYASNGQDIPAVYDFAARHGLRVIEDAAHGFGCMRGAKRIGAEGDVICFSFDGIKNITSGEGGAVVTGDAELARRIEDARLLSVERDTEKRFQGERSWSFDVHRQGFRYHMSNLMAAIGREQLKKFERFASRRRACAAHYRERLAGIPALTFPEFDHAYVVPHIFVVRITDGRRNALMEELRGRGIECGVHYMPNHLLDYFATDYRLPTAESLGNELLSLPLHAELTVEEQDRVIAAVRSMLK